MSRTPGDRFGKYEVLGLIGSGGMGEVYRARDPRLERDVAIKAIRASSVDGDDARARLWREARAAASVSHPAICQIFDVGEVDDDIFIVMELLTGEPLANRLKDGAMPLDNAVTITLAVLGALTALHGRGVVHRDLKPSNVFLTEGGVKLLDFGLARSRHSIAGDMTVTRAGMVVGTPRYMAPEQWTEAKADSRTDLFSVGSLLFEMLSGGPAFPGDDLMKVYHAVMSGQPPPLSGSAAVAAVDAVIHRALEKRPDDRYRSAEEMAQALRAAVTLASTTTTQAPVRATTRLIALPFRMLRPDADLDFLAFSLPDAVSGSLAGLQSLVVRSTLAGAKYASAETIDLKAIAANLGVDAVLTGTLLRAGDQVRVTAQLVEAASGTMLWSKTVQLAMRDLFEIQDQLARAIVESLSIPLSTGERRQLTHDLPANARAYEFYLRANQVSHDPDDAVGRGRALSIGARRRSAVRARVGQARTRLSRAREIQHRECHRTPQARERRVPAGTGHQPRSQHRAQSLHQLRARIARGAPKEAMARLLVRAGSSSDPEIYTGLVIACRFCGLLDASLAADRHARRLDPSVRTSVMYTHFMRGDWERAIATDTDTVKWVTNWTLPLVGRHLEAIEGYRELEGRTLPGLIRALITASRLVLEGKTEEGRRLAESFVSRHFDPEGLYFTSRVFAKIDDHGRALDMLDRVIDGGFFCPTIMLRDPWLDSLRGHARFNEIVARAEARSRDAEAEFRRLGGDRLLS
jgi:serine/threonine protein kinase